MSRQNHINWTSHALKRIRERDFSQEMAEQTFKNPDQVSYGKQSGTMEFIKRFGRETVTLIGRKNEKNEWVIISAWIDPPRPGTRDFYKKQKWRAYQKLGFWGKLWYLVKRQIGF